MTRRIALTIVCVLLTGLPAFAQPAISQSRMPANAPPKVREQVEKLYSARAEERRDACFALADMKAAAAPAVLFLIALLPDQERVLASMGPVYHGRRGQFTVGQVAESALLRIGRTATGPLSEARRDPATPARDRIAHVLGKTHTTWVLDQSARGTTSTEELAAVTRNELGWECHSALRFL